MKRREYQLLLILRFYLCCQFYFIFSCIIILYLTYYSMFWEKITSWFWSVHRAYHDSSDSLYGSRPACFSTYGLIINKCFSCFKANLSVSHPVFFCWFDFWRSFLKMWEVYSSVIRYTAHIVCKQVQCTQM